MTPKQPQCSLDYEKFFLQKKQAAANNSYWQRGDTFNFLCSFAIESMID